ncbi:MAG: hypothetical protein ACLQPH_16210 [Acidimicrobiales bacterium]
MIQVRHRWLRPAEHVVWHGLANRGPGDTRQVGGRLFVTDQRLVFEPIIMERFAQEQPWEGPVDQVELTIGPGSRDPHVPILRDIALRYEIIVTTPDGDEEHSFVTHVGEPLTRRAGGDHGPA